MSALLNGKELAALLGISESLYHVRRKQGAYRMFEVTRPVNAQRRYSRVLVEQYVAGESVVAFGVGSRKYRRTA